MKIFDQLLTRAEARISEKQGYARDVLYGRQRWSGADLQGKAKKYGAWYAEQREEAGYALKEAGGFIIHRENGLICAAMQIGVGESGILYLLTYDNRFLAYTPYKRAKTIAPELLFPGLSLEEIDALLIMKHPEIWSF